MATENRTESSLDGLIRRLVREELRNIFNSIHSADFVDEPAIVNLGETAQEATSEPTVIRRQRRKPAFKKGQVRNPKTDRRLKANREANA